MRNFLLHTEAQNLTDNQFLNFEKDLLPYGEEMHKK